MGQKIKCKKCGEIIESTYRHDFKICKCGAIFIDGENDYTRIGGFPEDILIINEDGSMKEFKGVE